MDPRQELEELRRIDELERKAGGGKPEPLSVSDRFWGSAENAKYARNVRDRIGTGVMDPFWGVTQAAAKVVDTALSSSGQNIIKDAKSVLRGEMPEARPGILTSYVANALRKRNKDYEAPEGVDAARVVGNVLSPLSWINPGAGAGTGFWGSVLGGAASGAVQAGIQPVNPDINYAKEKAKQVSIGGVTGGVVGAATEGVKKIAEKVADRVAKGIITPTEAAAELRKAGVELTPGQVAGGKLNEWEQKATSSPIVGDTVSAARNRARESFEQVAVEKASGIPGVKTIQEANEAISGQYEKAVPHIKPTTEGYVQVQSRIDQAGRNPELTGRHGRILGNLHERLDSHFGQSLHDLAKGKNVGDTTAGEVLKRFDSEIGQMARDYGKFNSTPTDKAFSRELYEIQQQLREAFRHGIDNPEISEILNKANEAYRRMVPLNKAASRNAAEELTPAALKAAIAKAKQRDSTRILPGADEMMDYARKGVEVLGKTVPDSGTVGRASLPATVAAAVTFPGVSAATWATAKMLYSRGGISALTGNPAVRQALDKMSPAIRETFEKALRTSVASATAER